MNNYLYMTILEKKAHKIELRGGCEVWCFVSEHRARFVSTALGEIGIGGALSSQKCVVKNVQGTGLYGVVMSPANLRKLDRIGKELAEKMQHSDTFHPKTLAENISLHYQRLPSHLRKSMHINHYSSSSAVIENFIKALNAYAVENDLDGIFSKTQGTAEWEQPNTVRATFAEALDLCVLGGIFDTIASLKTHHPYSAELVANPAKGQGASSSELQLAQALEAAVNALSLQFDGLGQTPVEKSFSKMKMAN